MGFRNVGNISARQRKMTKFFSDGLFVKVVLLPFHPTYWVQGQGSFGSHGSRVNKSDPVSSLCLQFHVFPCWCISLTCSPILFLYFLTFLSSAYLHRLSIFDWEIKKFLQDKWKVGSKFWFQDISPHKHFTPRTFLLLFTMTVAILGSIFHFLPLLFVICF